MDDIRSVLDRLRVSTNAGRVTLRLESPDAPFPVVAESIDADVASIKGDDRIDPTTSPGFKVVERERQILIQNDCLVDPPSPGRDLIDLYGVRAQMLAPVELRGQLVGVISVHSTTGPRSWSEEDVAALEHAVQKVVGQLESV
jgi:GAF domain-containing protein